MGRVVSIAEFTEQLIAERERCASLEPLLDAVRTPDWRKRLHATRALFAEARRLGVKFDAYETGLEDYLSPIESRLWCDIRGVGLPMIAGVPVERYWLDFADEERRIAIEADGKEYHDIERDRARDADLARMGWLVFRVTGAECHRVLPSKCNLQEEGAEREEIEAGEEAFYLTTSEGVCRAIRNVLYRRETTDPRTRDLMLRTLILHTLQDDILDARAHDFSGAR